MPKPLADETVAEFVPRCMIDPDMIEQYPEEDQRLAVCQSVFKVEAIEAEILTFDSQSIVKARAARMVDQETKKLASTVLEGLGEVSSQWLGNATPIVEAIIAKAESETLSDADFIRAVEALSEAMPDLFDKLDWRVLAKALEDAQGSAMANGAIKRHREFLKEVGPQVKAFDPGKQPTRKTKKEKKA